MRSDQHVQSGPQVGHDGVVPVRQDACDHVLQTFGTRQDVGRQEPVAPVLGGVLGVVCSDGRRGNVVGATPEMGLLVAVPFGRRLLVETLQRAVVTLVQPPVTPHRQPRLAERGQRQVGRLHGPGQQRRVARVEPQAGGGERGPGSRCLPIALRRERDVVPAGEEVLLVPGALAVAEQYERAGHGGDVTRATVRE